MASRKAAFYLQFLQSYFYGPPDSPWSYNFIFGQIGVLGFRKALFFMDCSNSNLYCLSPFYITVFNMWKWIEIGRLGCDAFLYWFLMEPVLGDARLGIALEEALLMYETFNNKHNNILAPAGAGWSSCGQCCNPGAKAGGPIFSDGRPDFREVQEGVVE